MNTKLLFLFTTLTIFFSACSNEDTEITREKTESGLPNIVTFKSSSEFRNTQKYLNSLNLDELKSWSKQNMIESYFDLTYFPDSTLSDRSYDLRAVLNKDLEFKINDSILWYNNNKIYYLTDEVLPKEELAKIKLDTANLSIYTSYHGLVFHNQSKNARASFTPGAKLEIGEKTTTLTTSQLSQIRSRSNNYSNTTKTKFVAVLSCEYLVDPDSEMFNRMYAQAKIVIKMMQLINGVYSEVKDAGIRYRITNDPWYYYSYDVQLLGGGGPMSGGGYGGLYDVSGSPMGDAVNYSKQSQLPNRIFLGRDIIIFKTEYHLRWGSPQIGWNSKVLQDVDLDIDNTYITIDGVEDIPLQIQLDYKYY